MTHGFTKKLNRVSDAYHNITKNYNPNDDLYFAIQARNTDRVLELLGHGISVELDCNGNRPLHLAVLDQNIELVKIFLEKYAANPNVKNAEGQTAYSLSLSFDFSDNNPEILERARISHWPSNPLKNAIEIIGLLRRHDADPEIAGKDIVRPAKAYENALLTWEQNQAPIKAKLL